ncbi:MAG: hypothetical protein AVDCRST_MAG21-948, partial [uncultured Nocardioidaceae bacterium]
EEGPVQEARHPRGSRPDRRRASADLGRPLLQRWSHKRPL